MITTTIQVGNSDDKLTQREWSGFVSTIHDLVMGLPGAALHFSGGSACAAPWQNYCWVFVCNEADIPTLKKTLSTMARQYNQDSIAVTLGQTEMVAGRVA